MRAEARALLIDAFRDAYCWQDELIRDSRCTIEAIAAREKKTERSIRMTLSLACLSPALVKAAIEGRLSRGFGVKRLMDLPMGWSDQWSALGLKAPAARGGQMRRGGFADRLVRRKSRKYRAILGTRKSRRFARTSWWWTQSGKTSLWAVAPW
jgi:hypothetical protein